MNALTPLWVQIVVALLILLGCLFALVAGFGLAFLRDGFQRLHPPALASTCGAWFVCAAALIYFSFLEHAIAWYIWLIPILLSITVPVSTLMIARAALFRQRQINDPDVPPPLP